MAKRAPKTFESIVALADGFLQEFQAETDRGTTVVIGAYLDDLLGGMLRSYLVDAPKLVDNLLDVQGALGTFSSRINLVYCLGLIREDQFQDLDTIRRMRNVFAHSHQALNFEEQSLSDWIANLKQLSIMNELREQMTPEHRDLLIDRFRTLRERFVGNALHLAIGLMVRGANLVHQNIGSGVDNKGSKLPFEGG